MLSLGQRYVKSDYERWVIPERGRFMKWFNFTVVLRLSYYDAVAAYLLGCLVEDMDVHNRCLCHPRQLARILNRHVSTVYRKLHRLQDLRLIELKREEGRLVVDINPSMVNRSSKIVLHHFSLPMSLPSDSEIDRYFAKLKKVPEVAEFDCDTGEIYE